MPIPPTYRDESLLTVQGVASIPVSTSVTTVTNPLLLPVRAIDRLANFPEETWDRSPESHLSRLAGILLGDAGAGRLRKATLLQRMRTSIYGAHFLDLDNFYGALFGAERLSSESFTQYGDPSLAVLSDAEWEDIASRDDSYRSRIEQMAQGFTYGGAATAMRLVAQAFLGDRCDVYEGWVANDALINSSSGYTYGQIEADSLTYGDLQNDTYGELQPTGLSGAGQSLVAARTQFVIYPHRSVSAEERYAIIRVLDRLKPVGTQVSIVSTVSDSYWNEVPLAAAWADSENWTIRRWFGSLTSDDGSAVAVQRPVFSQYQGEAWSYLPDALRIWSYETDLDGQVIASNVHDSIGDYIAQPGQLANYAFLPRWAVTSSGTVFAGRAASDAIGVISPYGAFLPSPTTPASWWSLYSYQPSTGGVITASAIQVDSYPLTGIVPLTDTAVNKAWAYWASPRRNGSDPTAEVMEVDFHSSHLVNHVSFELSRYPCSWSVEIWSDYTGGWVVLNAGSVMESFPPVLVPSGNGSLPMEHQIDGHWRSVSAGTAAVAGNKLRVVLKRLGLGLPLMGGQAVAYSLAMRNLDVGYRVTSPSDIPAPEQMAAGVLDTTLDVTGSIVSLQPYTQVAGNVLSTGSESWRCAPQPIHDAVVNLYLSVADSLGAPQRVDGFDLDPVRSGPTFNLYSCSDDSIHGDFQPSDDAVSFDTIGQIAGSPDGLSFDAGSELAIYRRNLGVDLLASAWQVALCFTAQTSSDDANASAFFVGDTGTDQFPVVCGLGPGTCWVSVGPVDDPLTFSVPVSYAVGESVTLLLGYDPTGDDYGYVSLQAWCQTTGATRTLRAFPKGSDVWSSCGFITDYAGADQPIEIQRFLLTLASQDSWRDIDDVVPSMDEFLLGQPDGSPIPSSLTNALLRYHPRFGSPGFIIRGGTPRLDNLRNWTPVLGNYRLVKGRVRIPPTVAKYFCFEFTNLVPEQIGRLLVTPQMVQRFPASALSAPPMVQAINAWPGMNANAKQSRAVDFTDSSNAAMLLEGVALTSIQTPPATAGIVASDPQRQAVAARESYLLRFVPWQTGASMGRFATTGPHPYDTYVSTETAKVGFFVGLNQVQPLRFSYVAAFDETLYDESFEDLDDLDTASLTFDVEDSALTSVSLIDSVAESTVYNSQSAVTGVAFATQQSDAVQILPDDTFASSRFAQQDWIDGDWHIIGDASASWDYTSHRLTLNRAAQSTAPQDDVSGLMAPPLSPLFAPIPATTVSDHSRGGLVSPPVSISPKGWIWAAVKFTVTKVPAPGTVVTLSILGSDGVADLGYGGATVLASKSVNPAPNKVTTAWVGYQIGSADPTARPDSNDPNDQPILAPLVSPPFGEPGTLSTPPVTPIDQTVSVVLSQTGQDNLSFSVTRMSLFDTSIVWEFSNDGGQNWAEASDEVRGNRNGVVSFPANGTQLRWRVTAYRPGMKIGSLRMRPRYTYGVKAPTPIDGPNLSMWDHEPPLSDDAYFTDGPNVVPQWWMLPFGVYPWAERPLTIDQILGQKRMAITVVDAFDTMTDQSDGVLSAFEVVPETEPDFVDTVGSVLYATASVGEPMPEAVDEAWGVRYYSTGTMIPFGLPGFPD